MNITKITATGVKGLDFDHNLSAVNVIVGQNFSGKTAIIDSIRLALMGYLPELGKSGPSTMGLAGNGALAVTLSTDDGRMLVRKWASKGGTVKATTEGDCPGTPTVLLNPEEYFSMGDKDRIRYVFSLAEVEAPEFTADAIIAAVKSIRCEGHGEQHEKVIQQQVGFIDSNDRVRHEAGQSIQDWVEALCVEMRGKLTLARAGQKRMAETVRGQTTLTAGEETAQTRDCEAELKQATEQCGVLRGTLLGLERDRNRLDGVLEKRRTAERQIAGAVDRTGRIEEIEKELARMRTKCDGYQSKQSAIAIRLRLASADQSSARTTVEQIGKEIDLRVFEHSQHIKAKECPHCGANGGGWQDSIVHKFQAKIAELNGQLEVWKQRLECARATVAGLESDMKDAIGEDDENNIRLRAISGLQSEINDLRRQQKEIDTAKATLAGIEEVDPKQTIEISLAITDKQKEAARLADLVHELTARQRSYVQWRQDEARNAQAILAGLEVGAEVEVLKAVVAILEALQVAMVKKAFETILERANKVTKDIMLTPLEYHDGEIGRFQGGQWISHRTFSGTEKALTYAGISVALAWDAPIKIVLMDELGRIDEANQRALVQRMFDLVESGHVDQFVGAATEWQTTDKEEALNVIRL